MDKRVRYTSSKGKAVIDGLAKGETKTAIAERLGTTIQTVARWEHKYHSDTKPTDTESSESDDFSDEFVRWVYIGSRKGFFDRIEKAMNDR